jgi:hypothetical protein
MTRRSMRRLMPALLVVALAVFPIVVSTVVSSCSENDPFVTRHCAFNDNPRVSTNRVVTLFAVNYIYVSARDDEATRHAYLGHADEVISSAYDEANRIFRDDNINLQIVSLPTLYGLCATKRGEGLAASAVW